MLISATPDDTNNGAGKGYSLSKEIGKGGFKGLINDSFSIFSTIPSPFYVKDSSRRYIHVNEHFERLVGYSLDELIGKTDFEVLPLDKAEEVDHIEKEVLKGRNLDREELWEGKEGETVFKVKRWSVNRADGNGDDKLLFGVFFDITEEWDTLERLKKSEREKDLILNTISEFVTYQDLNHRIYFANEASYKAIGLKPEQVIGRYCYELWGFSRSRCLNCPLSKALKMGKSGQVTIEMKNGRTWEIKGYPVKGGNGRVIGLIEVAEDVTEKNRIFREIEKKERWYRFLVENISDVVFEQDANLKVTYISPSVEKYTGYTPEEIIQKNISQIMTPESYQRGVKHFLKYSKIAEARPDFDIPPMEYEYIKKDGTTIWGELKVKFVRNKNGEIVGLQGAIRDVNERKEMQKTLEFERNQLLSIFNGIDEPIYVVDVDTYEILFVNKSIIDLLGYNPVGRKCYREFQNNDSPCEFCTNSIIMRDKNRTYQWEHHNSKMGRDYLLFDRYIRWPDGRDAKFELAIDVTDKKRAEVALEESEKKYRMLFEYAADAILITDLEGNIIDVNKKLSEYTGLERQKLFNKSLTDIMGENVFDEIKKIIGVMGESTFEDEIIRSDGTRIPVSIASVVVDYRGKSAVLSIIRDITRRKELEKQLSIAQKMEAIGRLAGGMAHDFNNLLTVIMGYVDIILLQKDTSGKIKNYVEEIKNTSRKAAELVSQLLAFSRRQMLLPKVIDVNKLILGLQKMISRIIGEDILIKLELWPGVKRVKVDPTQLEQVFMNIIVNAKDAMPEGGLIRIRTENVVVDESCIGGNINIKPGEYVLIDISDTGTGMNDDIQRHIFEPFFTTKESGKGTGLGLSTAYGIVKQSGGEICVESEEGVGSSFKIYLPVYESMETEEPYSEKSRDEGISGRGEKILVVEDENIVRNMIVTILKEWGYNTFSARDGFEALRIASGESFDLVITDVVMPGMSGKELAERLRVGREDIKILFISGYTDNKIAEKGILDREINFLQKPFTPKTLLKRIRNVLKKR